MRDAASPPPPVACVIVTYHPGDFIHQVADAILPQVDRVYLVDNGSDAGSRKALDEIGKSASSKVILIRNETNEGLAAALNTGVAAARKDGFGWFLLLDHDSVAAPGMVADLFRTLDAVRGENPGILSPWHVDAASGRRYRYVSFGKVLFRRVRPAQGPISCGFCMTSGSLVRKEVFDRVGGFREDYFVYAVDNEFCRRVRDGGFGIFVSDKAFLYHREGNAKTAEFLPAGRHLPAWGPRSLYYIFRNIAYDLGINPLFPSRWYDRLFLAKTAMSILLPGNGPRGERLAAAWRGYVDGKKGKLGKADAY